MIKKINSITNLAVFENFVWDSEVCNDKGSSQNFQHINIIYGRNYSGKTTLSRILRAMETGELSDKFEDPSFSVELTDNTQVTQYSLQNHREAVRVFNEDFVRDNLRFISNPDDNIESFAILGDDNNKIEKEIIALEEELGTREEGQETGLYAQKVDAINTCTKTSKKLKEANDTLEKQLKQKATDKKTGIKYNAEKFGDQNYNINKLKDDIDIIQDTNYRLPAEEELKEYESLISENIIDPILPFHAPVLSYNNLVSETETLVTQSISKSDKIEELVKDAVLNRWVNEGRTYHKDKREKCAFCGNDISEERWKKLEKHFDEESERLEKDIDTLISKIEKEKNAASSALTINKSHFYSKFHNQLQNLDEVLRDTVNRYGQSLDTLMDLLKSKKDDILNYKSFKEPIDVTDSLKNVWNSYKSICTKSDSFTTSLGLEQVNAKKTLRLKEIYDYLITIDYNKQIASIDDLNLRSKEAEQKKKNIENDINQKEDLIASKKRELNDEEKGAKKVNEYLNNLFGHQFLKLEAQEDIITEEGSKQIRFEVIRDGKKAYHLSEGECSLLAFCYFLAKLDDIDTRDSKPVIWIDDPISSLDGNHIFFVFSLLHTEIVSAGKFEQLFVSTHNLEFLKYLKRLNGKYSNGDSKQKDFQKGYFIVVRQGKVSTLRIMPKYLKEYVTEFNYLFHQIYKCSKIKSVDDGNYATFYNFGNNARKFLEIYLYYKYPDQGMTKETLKLFFGDEKIPAVLTDRINNEYSHFSGVFERGSTPLEVPEMQTAAKQIVDRLKEDTDQYSALLRSIGVAKTEESLI